MSSSVNGSDGILALSVSFSGYLGPLKTLCHEELKLHNCFFLGSDQCFE
jgi:hypothetical protein